LNKKYICKKPYTFKSFPHDHLIEKGEVVTLQGYLMGKEPLVELDDLKHSSGYDHLPHVRCVIQKEEFEKHFEEEINDAR